MWVKAGVVVKIVVLQADERVVANEKEKVLWSKAIVTSPGGNSVDVASELVMEPVPKVNTVG